MLHPFRLHHPGSLEEAITLRADLDDKAAIYAGGTELLLAMKMGILRYEHLIDIKRIEELRGIWIDDGMVRIRATVTHREIEHHPGIDERLPVLAEQERNVANVRVRCMGTLAGNLAFAEPHADPPALLWALGARVAVQGRQGRRVLSMDEFCVGAYESALGPDEVIVAIEVPILPHGWSASYVKFQVLERPSVGVAAVGEISDGVFVQIPRVVVGAVDERPRPVPAEMLGGKAIDDSAAVDEICDAARGSVEPVDDLGGSADYKRQLVEVLTRRAIVKLAETVDQ
jgi:aerobic carbon-monoxide dehydrogenase medium subunit